MRSQIRSLLAPVIVLCALTSACVSASDGDLMRADLEALKAEQSSMNKRLTQREAEMAEMIAQARKDVSQLQSLVKQAEEALQKSSIEALTDVRRTREETELLRGKLEEMEFKLSKLESDLKLFKEDVDIRLSSRQPEEPLPENATELLKLAQTRQTEGDPKRSRKAFEAFISRFPEDSRVDEAIFGLGESYMAERQHVNAILAYQRILKEHKRSKRLPDATFRIGQGFEALNKCKEAGIFYETVIKDHGKSKVASEAKDALEKLKQRGCGA